MMFVQSIFPLFQKLLGKSFNVIRKGFILLGVFMKNVFGLNVKSGGEEVIDGQVFRENKVSSNVLNYLDESIEDAEKMDEQTNVPKWMKIIKAIAVVIFFGCVLSILALTDEDVLFVQVFREAPYFYVGAVICAAIWGVLFWRQKRKLKNILLLMNINMHKKKLKMQQIWLKWN